jgi:PRTRC genetic system ThiF family protein
MRFVLAGCGGSGSWLAPSIVRLARVLREAGQDVAVTFVDPDIVEAANVPRQNFCEAEIDRPKATALAARYGAAWGLEIRAVVGRFDPNMATVSYDEIAILIGCVDNAAARQSLAAALRHSTDSPSVWWLDCGNARESGQVLVGSASRVEALQGAFRLPSVCAALPSPALQHPELLTPLPEEVEGSSLSCEQIAVANAQSLMVNQRVAAEAADFLLRLTVGGLRRFATYFDLNSGSARSKYTTPESVAAAVGQTPEQLFGQPAAHSRKDKR